MRRPVALLVMGRVASENKLEIYDVRATRKVKPRSYDRSKVYEIKSKELEHHESLVVLNRLHQ